MFSDAGSRADSLTSKLVGPNDERAGSLKLSDPLA
jgi:hypothetical protein